MSPDAGKLYESLLSGIAFSTAGVLVMGAVALLVAYALHKAEHLCPDPSLWRIFRIAALCVAGIDLALLVALHAAHAWHVVAL